MVPGLLIFTQSTIKNENNLKAQLTLQQVLQAMQIQSASFQVELGK